MKKNKNKNILDNLNPNKMGILWKNVEIKDSLLLYKSEELEMSKKWILKVLFD